ncbi:hypothetical protein PAHAL_5G457000 [Panicum hallii]|uniref:Uncharacterized protein n=1 Tax=Panicum hallii TaxID=206008 RepID=A0A2S3HXE0_9POAL|nr:hypothetical protein PAHAL_5G457000 [Panicum hallii]
MFAFPTIIWKSESSPLNYYLLKEQKNVSTQFKSSRFEKVDRRCLLTKVRSKSSKCINAQNQSCFSN